MTLFHVGQMVVCIKGDGPTFPGMWRKWGHILEKMPKPSRGYIYTVRDVEARTPILTLRLEELVGPIVETRVGPFEIPYAAYNFRPVKETNIDIFRELVAPKPKVEA